MATRVYVTNHADCKWLKLAIPKQFRKPDGYVMIEFVDGKYSTDDRNLQQIVEEHPRFGQAILHQDDPDIIVARAAADNAAKMQGGYASSPDQAVENQLVEKGKRKARVVKSDDTTDEDREREALAAQIGQEQ